MEKVINCMEAVGLGSHWSYWFIHVYGGRGHKTILIRVCARSDREGLETRRWFLFSTWSFCRFLPALSTSACIWEVSFVNVAAQVVHYAHKFPITLSKSALPSSHEGHSFRCAMKGLLISCSFCMQARVHLHSCALFCNIINAKIRKWMVWDSTQ